MQETPDRSPDSTLDRPPSDSGPSSAFTGKTRWNAAALLFLLAILPFLPTLQADYLNWDDDLYFTANPDIQTPGGWRNALGRFGEDANIYPVILFSFVAEHRLFGTDPRISHGINLVLHGGVTVTAFLLLLCWVPDPRIAFWAALFFAVHPFQVSTVAWVAERKSLLGSFFFLSALWVGAAHQGRGGLGWSLPLAAAAYLCKSPLVVFPMLLLGSRFLFRPGEGRMTGGTSPFWVAHFALSAAFAWVYSSREVSQSLSWVERAELVPKALAHYLAKWVYPSGLVPVYPKWELAGIGMAVTGWTLLLLVVAVAFYVRKRIDRLEGWGVFFFLATLAPALGFVSFGYQKHSFVSDHFMYLPLLGLSVLLASAITRISFGRTFLLPLLCVGIVGLWGSASWMECGKWKSPRTFWTAVLQADPESWIARLNLATHLETEGEFEEAHQQYRLAVEIDPDEPIGWINWGRSLILRGELEEAARALARAIDLNVYYVEAHLLRAEAFLRMGEEQRAGDQYHSAVAVRPGDADARLRMADLLLHAASAEVRNATRAIRILRPFSELTSHPQSLTAWSLMAEAYARLGDFDQAIALERRGLERLGDSDSPERREILRRISFYERGFAPNLP